MTSPHIPFQRWCCDQCGTFILSPEDGWIEWTEEDGRLTNFRIVHHIRASPLAVNDTDDQGCYGDLTTVGNMYLEQALGADGLAWLLEIIDRDQRVDQASFAELVRRLQIPHYEEARNHPVSSVSFETNGIREFTQAGITMKLRVPALH